MAANVSETATVTERIVQVNNDFLSISSQSPSLKLRGGI